MGRRATGWRIRERDNGTYEVRFTHEGRRHELALGTRDPDEAARRAPNVYAATITGRRPSGLKRREADPRTPLDELLSLWLASVKTTRSEGTQRTWEVYARHFLGPLKSAADLTPAGVARYVSTRLGVALRATVSKELSALRHFLGWAHDTGHLADPVVVPPIDRSSSGTRTGIRKERHQALAPSTVEAVLAELPERSLGRGNPGEARKSQYAIRAFFRLAWETGLRPGTLEQLVAPTHYRKGADHLVITAEIDKNRYARRVVLTSAARAALDAVVPAEGVILGRHDRRRYLRAAAVAAGLTGAALEELCAYDLRHSRITHLLEQSGNLPGVAHLIGHRRVTTTNKYAHGSERAAAAVLATVEVPSRETERSGADSGAGEISPKHKR